MYKFFAKKVNKKRKGFTLVELLVVIAIIAILVAIAAVGFKQTTGKAALATHNANVRTIQSVASIYLLDHPDATSVTSAQLKADGYLQDEVKTPAGVPNVEGGIDYTVSFADGDIAVTPPRQ